MKEQTFEETLQEIKTAVNQSGLSIQETLTLSLVGTLAEISDRLLQIDMTLIEVGLSITFDNSRLKQLLDKIHNHDESILDQVPGDYKRQEYDNLVQRDPAKSPKAENSIKPESSKIRRAEDGSYENYV